MLRNPKYDWIYHCEEFGNHRCIWRRWRERFYSESEKGTNSYFLPLDKKAFLKSFEILNAIYWPYAKIQDDYNVSDTGSYETYKKTNEYDTYEPTYESYEPSCEEEEITSLKQSNTRLKLLSID